VKPRKDVVHRLPVFARSRFFDHLVQIAKSQQMARVELIGAVDEALIVAGGDPRAQPLRRCRRRSLGSGRFDPLRQSHHAMLRIMAGRAGDSAQAGEPRRDRAWLVLDM
jgi:hypothetical protein